MKIRGDFVTNSSSTSFLMYYDHNLTEDEWATKAGQELKTVLLRLTRGRIIENSDDILKKLANDEDLTIEEFKEEYGLDEGDSHYNKSLANACKEVGEKKSEGKMVIMCNYDWNWPDGWFGKKFQSSNWVND